MAVSLRFNLDSTGASTLNWCGLGAKGIKKSNGKDFINIKNTGIYTLRYDGVNFILQGEGGSGNAIASDLALGKTATTDAGEIVGTNPYKAGGDIEVKNTNAKAALVKFYPNTDNYITRILCEDDLYIYFYSNESTPKLKIYNKQTGKFTSSVDGISETYTPLVYSVNDGYCYVLTGNIVKKIRCLDGKTIWNYQSGHTMTYRTMKVLQNYLCIFYNYGGVHTGFLRLDITTGGKSNEYTILTNKTPRGFITLGDFVYFASGNTVYKCEVVSGSIMESETVTGLTNSNSSIDYINKIYYIVTSKDVSAYNYTGNLLWTHTFLVGMTYTPSPIIIMKDGLYLHDYSEGLDIKIGIDGNLIYTNYGMTNVSVNGLYYDYELECFNLIEMPTANSFKIIGKIYEKLQIIN